MATVKCTKCHNPMQTNKAPGELEDCPKCKAVFEIPFTNAKFYHHSLPGMSQASDESPALSIFGSICLVIGLLVMGYFLMFYDTSVYGGSDIGYVHNINKGNNRTTGMIFGGFIAIVGTGLLIADQAKKK